MLLHVRTFNLLQAQNLKFAIDPIWANAVSRNISKLELRYPENIGSALWDDDGCLNGHQKGLPLAIFCLGALSLDAASLLPYPKAGKILTTAYKWGCEQTPQSYLEHLQAGQLGDGDFDFAQPAHYMCFANKGAAMLSYVNRVARGQVANPNWESKIDSLVYGAVFRFYHEMMVEWRILQDRLARRELVVCNDGQVAWNSRYKQKLFGPKPLNRDKVNIQVAEEMRQLVLALLEQQDVAAMAA